MYFWEDADTNKNKSKATQYTDLKNELGLLNYFIMN